MNEEYALLAMVPEPLAGHIKDLKTFLKKRIGKKYPSSDAPAHLTLCSFNMKAGRVEEIVYGLHQLMKEVPPIHLVTGDVGGFMASRTFFVSLENSDAYTALQRKLNDGLRERFPMLKRNMSIASKAHITIGRGFDDDEYIALIKILPEMNIKQPFVLDKVQLMTKVHDHMKVFQSWELKGKGM
jgi:2'-5' RNA ligase